MLIILQQSLSFRQVQPFLCPLMLLLLHKPTWWESHLPKP